MDFPTGGHHIAAADVVNRITAGGVINTDLNDMVARLLTRGDRARRGLRHDPLALHAGPQNGLFHLILSMTGAHGGLDLLHRRGARTAGQRACNRNSGEPLHILFHEHSLSNYR